MKTKTKIIRKLKRLLGWRKPHPKNIEREFDKMCKTMQNRQKAMEAIYPEESVNFIYSIWDDER